MAAHRGVRTRTKEQYSQDAQVLTDHDVEVIDNYFGVSNFNKTDALRRAGVKDANNALKFYYRKTIKKEIERRRKIIRKRYSVSYDRVLDEMAKLAYSSMLDYGEVRDDGSFKIDLSKANAHEMAALGEIKTKTYTVGRGADAEKVTETTIKPYSKQAALESLMRHAGLSKEKVKVELGVSLSDRILAARKRVGNG